jgi:AraC-like DNA-binding protein
MIYNIPVSAAGKVINYAETHGVSREKICRAVNLDCAKLLYPDAQIPFVQLIKLYEYAALLSGDPDFGLHLGEQSNPKMYELLGYVTMNSQTFGGFLDCLLRYQQIWTNAVRFSLETISVSDIHLSYIYRISETSTEERRHESENMLSVIMKMGRMVTAVNWMPRETHFEHQQPNCVSEHQRIFGEFVYFNRPQTRLVFDSYIMSLPVIEADPKLFAMLRSYAENLLPEINPEAEISARVSEVLGKSLAGGQRSIGVVSKQIGVSPRTLQRKLNEEGTSYHKLVEDVQRALSERYLKSSELTICEISYLVGFSQQSAFQRAFKRWKGITPKEFQRRNRPFR